MVYCSRHNLKADYPSSCLIPSTFLNLWVLVPVTVKQPTRWNNKAHLTVLCKVDGITTNNSLCSLLSTPQTDCGVLVMDTSDSRKARPVASALSAGVLPTNDQITRAHSVFSPCFVESHFPKMHFTWAMSLYSCTISHEKICPFHRTHGLNRPACVKIFPFISMPNDGTGLELRSRLP